MEKVKVKLNRRHADTLMRIFNCAGIGVLSAIENTPTDAMFGEAREATNWAKSFVVDSDKLQHRICKPGVHELSDEEITILYQTMVSFWLMAKEDARRLKSPIPRDIRKAFRACYDSIWEEQNLKRFLSPDDHQHE